MEIRQVVLVFFLVFLTSGCYGEMTGTVVDGETGLPIEGAVVLVEWTVTKGVPGMTVTERYKVVETLTDKDGKATISGVMNPRVNPPLIVIYKRGYVAWRSDFIFPDFKKRKDFEWRNKCVFKLESFKKNYSHHQHVTFISMGLSLHSSSKLEQAYAWESPYEAKELELYKKKLGEMKPNETNTKRIWEEVVNELYLQRNGDAK